MQTNSFGADRSQMISACGGKTHLKKGYDAPVRSGGRLGEICSVKPGKSCTVPYKNETKSPSTSDPSTDPTQLLQQIIKALITQMSDRSLNR